MNIRAYHWERLIMLCSLLFVAFFPAACSTGGSNTSTTPTAVSKPTPPTSSSVVLKTYTGVGFTIKYPSSWTAATAGNGKSGGGVTFSNPPTMTTFYIEILPNSNEAAPAAAVKGLTTGLQTGGKQAKIVPIAPTITVGGQTWDQAAGTTDLTHGGQTVTIEQVMIATNHPTSSPSPTLFIITYVTPAHTFDQTNTSTFLPMLQSFKFTS